MIDTNAYDGRTLMGFMYKGKYHSASKIVGRVIFQYAIDESDNRLYVSIGNMLRRSLTKPTPFIVDDYFYGVRH